MTELWTEVWSLGAGRSRTYCGLALTEEGFAVDVFVGDTCVESHEYRTSTDATSVALALKQEYQHVSSAERVRRTSTEFVLPPARDQQAVSSL